MDAASAREFIRSNRRGVLVTRRRDGGLQTSPVIAGIDEAGRVEMSTRETAYKVRNLRRDPALTLCMFTDDFFGRHIQVEGTAEIVSLPDAMDLLVGYYRRMAGEHENWDEYRAAMQAEKRLIVRFDIQRAGPDASG